MDSARSGNGICGGFGDGWVMGEVNCIRLGTDCGGRIIWKILDTSDGWCKWRFGLVHYKKMKLLILSGCEQTGTAVDEISQY